MKRFLAIVTLLACGGCAQMQALLGAKPDPRPADNAVDMRYFVQKDPDPVDAPRGQNAVVRADGLVTDYGSKSGLDAYFAPVIAAASTINPLFGLAGTLILGGLGLWLNSKQNKTAAAVDQHAVLLDSVTPPAADFAATSKPAAVVVETGKPV